MKEQILDLSILHLAIAYVFVLLLLVIFKIRGIKRERLILIASLRMTVQLTVMGYVLVAIFRKPSWWMTTLMVTVMLIFASYNAIKRVSFKMPNELKRIMIISLIAGSLFTAAFFIVVVLGIRPWYEPQYFIPITGMIIGNSMTGITLGANKLCNDMQDKREIIENSLMLGASPAKAAYEIVNGAFDSAILPTMNNMLTMGIVSLPGMMTGQILSGTFPLTAIKYQIGIMLAILGATALVSVVFLTTGYKTFFTRDGRLKY